MAQNEDTARRRDPETGRFLPQGKGGGGKRGAGKLKEAYQAACPAALALLVEIVGNTDSRDADRIRAAESILDRGYGRPGQAGDGGGEPVRVVFIGGDDLGD